MQERDVIGKEVHSVEITSNGLRVSDLKKQKLTHMSSSLTYNLDP